MDGIKPSNFSGSNFNKNRQEKFQYHSYKKYANKDLNSLSTQLSLKLQFQYASSAPQGRYGFELFCEYW